MRRPGGFLHVYNGQEAVAVGCIGAMRPTDPVITAYRDHGHALARGMDPKIGMAELFGRIDGCAKGKLRKKHARRVKEVADDGVALAAALMKYLLGGGQLNAVGIRPAAAAKAGAIFEDQPVVVDRHFVSSRKPDDLPDFCRGLLGVLTGVNP